MNTLDITLLTDYLHVSKLIGLGCTAYFCVTYLFRCFVLVKNMLFSLLASLRARHGKTYVRVLLLLLLLLLLSLPTCISCQRCKDMGSIVTLRARDERVLLRGTYLSEVRPISSTCTMGLYAL